MAHNPNHLVVTDRNGEGSDMTAQELKDFTEKLVQIGTGQLRGTIFLSYDTVHEGETATANFVKAHKMSRSEIFTGLCDALSLEPDAVYKLAAMYDTNYHGD